jgi:hypothetical protein
MRLKSIIVNRIIMSSKSENLGSKMVYNIYNEELCDVHKGTFLDNNQC